MSLNILWCSHAEWAWTDDVLRGLRARGHSVVETSVYDKETLSRASVYDAVVVDWLGVQAIRLSKHKPATKLVLRLHGADLAASDIVRRVEWSAFDAIISVRSGCESLIPAECDVHVIGYAVASAGTFVRREFDSPHRLGVLCPDMPGCGVDAAVKQWLAVDGREGGKAGKWNLLICAFGMWQYTRIARLWRRCSHKGMGNRVGLLGLDQAEGFWKRIEVAWSPGDDRAPDLPTLRAMATGAYPLVADRAGTPVMFENGAYFEQAGLLVRLGLWNDLPVEEKTVVSRQWHQFVVEKNGVDKIASEVEEVLSNG